MNETDALLIRLCFIAIADSITPGMSLAEVRKGLVDLVDTLDRLKGRSTSEHERRVH